MKVLTISIEKLLTYQRATGFGPAPSLTVVTGPNGSGKTALVLEAVAWALWGKTARGTVPDGNVTVAFDVAEQTYLVERKRAGRRGSSLKLWTAPGDDLSGQTATETQGKINALVGSWERFCATRVFSARLRARFGAATDKERKALLEGILGLERYERAARLARDEVSSRRWAAGEAAGGVRAARAAVTEAKRALDTVPPAIPENGLDVLLGRLEAARRLLYHFRDERARLVAVAEGLEQNFATLEFNLKLFRETLAEARGRLRAAEARFGELGDEASRALSMGDCPVCLTPAIEIDHLRLGEHFAGLKADVAIELASANLLATQTAAEVDEFERAASTIAQRLSSARWRAGEADQGAKAQSEEIARLEGSLALEEQRAGMEAKARAAHAAAWAREEEAARAEERAYVALQEAELAADALGSKGARVARMDDALRRLSAAANAVLGRLPVEGAEQPLRLQLTATRALKGGGEVDEVTVRVEGAGGGEYDGLSDGERARVDVALLLGMARVAGDRDGYLVFDEVFDSLDPGCLEPVVELLVELSRERQVVVATHNPRFLDHLPAGTRVRVSRGEGGSQFEVSGA